MKSLKKISSAFGLLFLVLIEMFAQNPFLPAWEYIPDGEPRVFGDRIYIYGSHDKAGSTTFCDTKYVVWSAPLSDPTNWTKDSESFFSKADENGIDDISWSDNDLYAPDVVEKGGKYYLYFYIVGAPGGVAVSNTPGGPFKLLAKYKAPAGSPSDFGGWGQYIDPGVLVDDDGRVYIYWGYKKSYMAEINPANMYEILPNTYKEGIIPTTAPFNFFEGASMRKINGKYYLIYAQGSTLAYATSSSPNGPFTYGGVIIRNGRDYPGGNIHGSLANVNGQWYIFYHRMTNNTLYSRKACAEKVTIEADGSIKEVDMTSLGFRQSLNPYQETSAHIACVLKGGNYITEVDQNTHPVIKNKNNSVIGFKFFDFTPASNGLYTRFTAQVRGAQASGVMEIWIDSFEPATGKKIGSVEINGTGDATFNEVSAYTDNVTGVHALYFKFVSDDKSNIICDLKSFGFLKTNTPNPYVPNTRPVVKQAINNIFVWKNARELVEYANLKNVFTDAEDGTNLTYEIVNVSNPAIVAPSITSGCMVNLSFVPNKTGFSTVTIKATDSKGKVMTTYFSVVVSDPVADNLVLFRKVTTSSVENNNYLANFINDANATTRWSSAFSDNQWVVFELKRECVIKNVVLNWDGAYGTAYNILISNNGTDWTKIYTTTTGDGSKDEIVISGQPKAKYVKLELIKRATPWGFSLWEVEVYGSALNQNPVVSDVAQNQNAEVGVDFDYSLPKNIFTDVDDEYLSYTAKLVNGNPLPAWLSFNSSLLKFSGKPTASDEGVYDIQISAIDGFNGTASTTFKLTVNPISATNQASENAILVSYNNSTNEIVFSQSIVNFCAYTIFDTNGRLLKANALLGNRSIPILLQNGVYFIKLNNKTQSQTQKFIVCRSK